MMYRRNARKKKPATVKEYEIELHIPVFTVRTSLSEADLNQLTAVELIMLAELEGAINPNPSQAEADESLREWVDYNVITHNIDEV